MFKAPASWFESNQSCAAKVQLSLLSTQTETKHFAVRAVTTCQYWIHSHSPGIVFKEVIRKYNNRQFLVFCMLSLENIFFSSLEQFYIFKYCSSSTYLMATYFHKLAPDVRLVVGNKESHHSISISTQYILILWIVHLSAC